MTRMQVLGSRVGSVSRAKRWTLVRRLVTTSIIILALVLSALPALAEVTQEELKAARAVVNEVADDLDEEMRELEDALLLKHQYEDRIAALRDEISRRDREIALAAYAAKDRARAMYVSAGVDSARAAVSPESINRHGTRSAYLDAVVDLDLDIVNELEYLQVDRASLQTEIDALLDDQESLALELEKKTEEILGQLEDANSEYQALYDQWRVEEAERQRKIAEARARAQRAAAAAAAAAAVSSGTPFTVVNGRTCPIAGASSFTDTWHEARSGGRVHLGVDMVAPTGTPLVAIENGYIWSPNWHYQGGLGLYVRGDSGVLYYYAHLNAYVPGLHAGQRVAVGELIGYVGSTGNSSIPHLHFSMSLTGSVSGSTYSNPYPLMVALCR